MTFFMASVSFATISGGVLAGARRPYHASSVKPFMPASSIVMTS